MRPFILIAAVVAAIFFWNRNSEQKADAPAPPPPFTSVAASTASTPSPAPQTSQAQHWPKRSIDRARAVANQARQNSTDAQP